MNRSSNKKTLYVILCCVIVLLVAGCVYTLNKVSNVKDLAEAVPLKTTSFKYACKGDPQSLPCLQKQYQKLTSEQGVARAFEQLKKAYDKDSSVKAGCHQLVHVIGRVQAEKSASISEVFSQGDQFCWAGYFHGAMETFIAKIGAENVVGKLPTVCAQIKAEKPYSFYHYNCVHGMGHGVFSIEDNDLMKTLSLCDRAGDSWEQKSCQGGAFMQNVMAAEDPNDHTDFLKGDQPMYPCTAVLEQYKDQCYLMQTSYALRLARQNFATVFAQCAGIEEKYRDTCYQSLGRDASGNSVSNVDQTKATCMLGSTQNARANCIIGAVKDFVSYFHSDKQATQLCQVLDASLSTVCEATKKSYYETF